MLGGVVLGGRASKPGLGLEDGEPGLVLADPEPGLGLGDGGGKGGEEGGVSCFDR